MMFKLVLFDDFDSMLLSRLNKMKAICLKTGTDDVHEHAWHNS